MLAYFIKGLGGAGAGTISGLTVSPLRLGGTQTGHFGLIVRSSTTISPLGLVTARALVNVRQCALVVQAFASLPSVDTKLRLFWA